MSDEQKKIRKEKKGIKRGKQRKVMNEKEKRRKQIKVMNERTRKKYNKKNTRKAKKSD